MRGEQDAESEKDECNHIDRGCKRQAVANKGLEEGRLYRTLRQGGQNPAKKELME